MHDESDFSYCCLRSKCSSFFSVVGKELFQTDKSLNDSDIKFLANTGDVAITVDESLFEVRLYLVKANFRN
jgi:hypothetical protein